MFTTDTAVIQKGTEYLRGFAPETIVTAVLFSMVGFLVAVVRTPLTGIVLITEITGHLDVFYPSIIVGGLTYYFTEMLQIKPFNVVL